MITTVPILVDEWFGVESFGTLLGAAMLGGAFGQPVVNSAVANELARETGTYQSFLNLAAFFSGIGGFAVYKLSRTPHKTRGVGGGFGPMVVSNGH